jgi:hypothetical protein
MLGLTIGLVAAAAGLLPLAGAAQEDYPPPAGPYRASPRTAIPMAQGTAGGSTGTPSGFPAPGGSPWEGLDDRRDEPFPAGMPATAPAPAPGYAPAPRESLPYRQPPAGERRGGPTRDAYGPAPMTHNPWEDSAPGREASGPAFSAFGDHGRPGARPYSRGDGTDPTYTQPAYGAFRPTDGRAAAAYRPTREAGGGESNPAQYAPSPPGPRGTDPHTGGQRNGSTWAGGTSAPGFRPLDQRYDGGPTPSVPAPDRHRTPGSAAPLQIPVPRIRDTGQGILINGEAPVFRPLRAPGGGSGAGADREDADGGR